MNILDKKFWHNYWTKKRIERLGAFLIGIFAVLLVFCSDLDGGLRQQIIINNVQQANAYSFFQAKRIRQVIREAILEDSESLSFLERSLTSEERDEFIKKRTYLLKKIEEFNDDNNLEGRKQLLQKARALEQELEKISYYVKYLGIAINLYQIAVVMSSISLIILSPMLLVISSLVGLTAIFFHMHGLL